MSFYKRKSFWWLSGLLITTSFLTWAVVTVFTTNVLPIKEVKVHGELKHITEADIYRTAREWVAKGLFSLDIYRLKHELERMSWCRHAHIKRQWPDTIHIHLLEEQALARWNEHHAINTEGEVFYPPTGTLSAKLVSLHGEDGSHIKVYKTYERVSDKLSQLGQKISHLTLEKRNSLTVRLENGLLIHLGRIAPIARLQRFINAYGKIVKEDNDIHKMESVDLRYPHGLSIKWKDKKKAKHVQLGYNQ